MVGTVSLVAGSGQLNGCFTAASNMNKGVGALRRTLSQH